MEETASTVERGWIRWAKVTELAIKGSLLHPGTSHNHLETQLEKLNLFIYVLMFLYFALFALL